MQKLSVFLVFLFASSIGSFAHAEDAITPDWSSNRILQQRTQSDDNAIVIAFRIETKADGKPDQIKSGTVRLWDDFDQLSTSGSEIITDYKLCRAFFRNLADTSYGNQSCHAHPAFRQMELHNRSMLNKVLQGAGVSDGEVSALDNPFWMEQEFATQNIASDPLTRTKSGDRFEWRLENNIVATASVDGFAFAKKDRQRFARYFARYLQIHPQIRREILANGMIPSRIEVNRRNFEGESVEMITFSSMERAKVGYPLSANLTALTQNQSREETIEGRAIRQTLEAIAGNVQPHKSSFGELLNRLEDAAKRGNSLETTLTFLEFTQLYGGAIMNEKDKLARLRGIMPIVQPLIGANAAANLMRASDLAGQAGEEPEREAAALYLANAQELDQIDFGTFRYVTYANLVRISKGKENWDKQIFNKMPSITDSYWMHIAVYPWASNAFYDLGDTWYSQFDTFRAWDVWDLGKAVDPDWQRGSMKSVANLENRIRASMPDNF